MEVSEVDDIVDSSIPQSWKEYPKLFSELNLTKNKGLTFRGKPIKAFELSTGTHKKLDWKCSVCDKEWSAQGGSRSRQGTGCPYCGGTNNSLHSDRRNSMKNTHPLPDD